MTASRLVALSLAFVALLASVAAAQSAPPKVELSGAILIAGGADFGTRQATLTGNDPGNPGFTLFSTTTTLGSGIGPEARLGIALTRMLSVEGAFSWLHQTLETRITGDAEGAPNTTATQPISTMSVGADALVRLTSMAFGGGRGVPFVLGGGGYLRQTDYQQMALASGGYAEAGGGVRYQLCQRPHGFLRTLALRGDGRVVVRSGQVDLAEATGGRTTWALSAGIAAGF